MNREIEFRAWLENEKKMVEVVSINFNDRLIAYNDNDKQELCINCSFNNIELMQYTGLKDRNDVKIFEGDIVKCKIGNVNFEGYVYFYGGRFEFIDFEDDEETEFLCYCDDLEVIGNVFENKELLEDE